MPLFNPAEFVTPWAPIGQYDLGRGLRSLANHNRETAALEERKRQANMQNREQQDSRRDENSRFAANLASTQGENAYQAAQTRYTRAATLVDAARKAVAAGDRNTALALAGSIEEMGGRVGKKDLGGGHYELEFHAPELPKRPPIDVSGMRQEIFGAPGGTIGRPFMLRGSDPTEGNPFEALPGASAAMMGPQLQAPADDPPPPAAAEPPPPGAASDPAAGGSGAPPAGVGAIPTVGDPAASPAAVAPPQPTSSPAPEEAPPPGALQLQQPHVGPNPFDPFRLNTLEMQNNNQARLQPFLDATANAFPEKYKNRVERFNQGVAALSLPPEESLKLYQPGLNNITSLMRAQEQRESASARTAVSDRNADESRAIRLSDAAWRNIRFLQDSEGLKKAKANFRLGSQIKNSLRLAEQTGNTEARYQLIGQLHDLNQSGVLTDADFTNARHGVQTVWQAFQSGAYEALVSNMDPARAQDIREFLDLALTQTRQEILDAQQQLYTQVERAGSEEERKASLDAIMGLIPKEMWTDDVKAAFGMAVPQKSGPMDSAGNYAVGKKPKGPGRSESRSGSSSKAGENITPGQASQEVDKIINP